MEMRSMLGRARGLGSAKEGVAHWWAQRVTAVALVPLLLWFVISVIAVSGADHAAFKAWASGPITATLLICLTVAAFYHAALGLQVVIEDYFPDETVKTVAIVVIKGACFLLATLAIVSVLKLAVGA